MDSLRLIAKLLDTKKFRDSTLKAIQFAAKFLLLQSEKDSPLQQPCKRLADHISVGRKLYRWGVCLESLFHCLSLWKKEHTFDVNFSTIFSIAACALISNIFDAISYAQSVLDRPKSRADRLCAFFYICGLTLSLINISVAYIQQNEEKPIKLSELGIEVTKNATNIATATNTAFPMISLETNLVAVSGVIAGILGMYQTYLHEIPNKNIEHI